MSSSKETPLSTITGTTMRFAGVVREGMPRAMFRSPLGDWVVVKRSHGFDAFGGGDGDNEGLVTRERFADEQREKALRSLVSEGSWFSEEDDVAVGDADYTIKTGFAEVHEGAVEFDAAGNVVDPSMILRAVETGHGRRVRARAIPLHLDDVVDVGDRPAPAKPATHQFMGIRPTSPEPEPDETVDYVDTAGAGADGSIELRNGERYMPRELFGRRDVDVLREIRGRHHVRLVGPPGGGKTTLPQAAFGDELITVQGVKSLTAASLLGQFLPTDPGSGAAWTWSDGPLTVAMREGKVLLIDEINRAGDEVEAAILSATDSRAEIVIADRPDLDPIQAADGFMVIITYNDHDHGTRPLSAALRRRMPVELRVDSDYAIAAKQGVDDKLILVANNLRSAATAFAATHNTTPRWYPQTPDLVAANAMLASFGVEAAAGVFTASCPDSTMHDQIRDVFTSVFGLEVEETSLGGIYDSAR